MADETGHTVINTLPNANHHTFHEPEFQTAGRDIHTSTINSNNHYHHYYYSSSTPKFPNVPPPHSATTTRPATALPTGNSERPIGLNDISNETRISKIQDVVHEMKSSKPTKPEAYVRNMSVAESGLACWRPGPHKPYRKSETVTVIPGDFGTYSASDSFRIISHYFMDQASIKATLNPPQGKEYNPPSLTVTRRQARPQNDIIAVGAATQMQRDIQNRPSFEFQCPPNSTEGAALVLTSPVESEDIDDPNALRHFILDNAETLYRYATSIRSLGEDESLYFITGCDKSKSWAMAAYTEAMVPPHNVLRLQWKDSQYDWTHRGKADARTGSGLDNNAPWNQINDQCLFLRGFKISFSQGFRERMSKVSSGQTTAGSRSGMTFALGNAHNHVAFHHSPSLPLPPMPDPANYIAGIPGLSKGLTRPLLPHEKEKLAWLNRLKCFLATAPSRWHTTDDQGTNGSVSLTPFAPNVEVYPGMGIDGSFTSHQAQQTPSHPQLNRFMLPSQEFVTCVLWNGLYHVTETDIVRALVFRFEAFGRPVRNMETFEESVLRDLRNLKAGVDACIEEPNSPFLNLLFKYQCIRRQKMQKVFYWFSVPHDRLFLDALDRDLKREKASQEPTTVIVGEPAASFTYDPKRTLYEQFSKSLEAWDNESEYVRNAVSGTTDGDDSTMKGSHGAEERDHHISDMEDVSGTDGDGRVDRIGKQLFSYSVLGGSSTYKQRQKTSTAASALPMTDPFGVSPDHPRAISTDQITQSTHPHRHSYHGVSLSDSFPDDFGFQMNSAYNQAPLAPDAASAGPSSLQGQAQQARPNSPAPAPVSSTAMYEQYSADNPIKAFVCPMFSCGRLFKRREYLKRHLHTHTMERPFTCPKCKKRFSRSDNLNQHLRTHDRTSSTAASASTSNAGEGSSGDSSTAAGPSSLQGQAQQARPNPPAPAPVSGTGVYGQHSADGKVKTFVCPLFSCGRLFKRMEHLKRHLRTHTMEGPLTCAKCKRRFSTSYNLNQHLRTHDYGPSGGTDVAMGNPEAGPGFAETFFRAGSPDFVAQTESPAPVTIEPPNQFGVYGQGFAALPHSATMPVQYPQ